ncbi:hypothetical protein E2C01_006775 [Portunus trituberculatus]|uniref:Uncharacterized protein n=1 Tax=Portunus trituberculatus TaxID=210409 RepID=A0A5B7CW94_PORTR|nr:hypothetical protein [Portunus trituberculatus]
MCIALGLVRDKKVTCSNALGDTFPGPVLAEATVTLEARPQRGEGVCRQLAPVVGGGEGQQPGLFYDGCSPASTSNAITSLGAAPHPPAPRSSLPLSTATLQSPLSRSGPEHRTSLPLLRVRVPVPESQPPTALDQPVVPVLFIYS